MSGKIQGMLADANPLESRLQAARAIYHDRRLSLFVGAGVSMSCGLPSWEQLSAALLEEAYPPEAEGWGAYSHMFKRSAAKEKGALDSMRLARRRLAHKFPEAVRKRLYGESAKLSATISALAGMRRLEVVCTYNYDDLLERAMREASRPHVVICEGDSFAASRDVVRIIHLHGFLPEAETAGHAATSDIVLSDSDYFGLFSDPLAWANVIQLHILLQGPALFIGCSLTDPNTRRLLDVFAATGFAHHHYALMRDPTYVRGSSGWHGIYAGPTLSLHEEELIDRGVMPLWYNEHSDLAELVDVITSDDGRPSFGSRLGEKEAFHRITELSNGGLGAFDIATQLNQEGIRPRLGWRPWWYGPEVAEILKGK